jgi:prepilin-type N-terminal cleavage/methylation domain-containing protein
MKRRKAFTLIEILLVIGIIVLLAGAIIVAINPGRQFAKARNTQRTTDVNDLLNGIVQNMTENQGRWNCTTRVYYATSLPASTATIVSASEADNTQINLSCLVPNILPKLPVDPSLPADSTTTGYTLRYETSSGRITVCAPSAELNETICTVR